METYLFLFPSAPRSSKAESARDPRGASAKSASSRPLLVPSCRVPAQALAFSPTSPRAWDQDLSLSLMLQKNPKFSPTLTLIKAKIFFKERIVSHFYF